MSDIRRGYGQFSLKICKKENKYVVYDILDGFIGFALVLSFFYLSQSWFLYITSIFFIPQIIHNACRGQKPKFDPCYVVLLSALRLIVPVINKNLPQKLMIIRFTLWAAQILSIN